MISCATVSKAAIRSHYDLAAPFYRLLWGPQVHHGLWDDQAGPRLSARAARERLIDTLAQAAGIRATDRVLDVGCGMGGSSVYLARMHGCDVIGITISPVQKGWASWGARWHGVRSHCRFLCGDVESSSFLGAPLRQSGFFQRAADWLAFGGRVAICAWLAAENADRPDKRRHVEQVCESFLCPSLGSFSNCAGWIDPAQADFLRHFPTLLSAYRNGAMHYGCLLAHRPVAP